MLSLLSPQLGLYKSSSSFTHSLTHYSPQLLRQTKNLRLHSSLSKSEDSVMLWTTNSNSGKSTSFAGDPEGYVKGTLWKWAPLSIGAPLGNLEVRSLTSDFERQ